MSESHDGRAQLRFPAEDLRGYHAPPSSANHPISHAQCTQAGVGRADGVLHRRSEGEKEELSADDAQLVCMVEGHSEGTLTVEEWNSDELIKEVKEGSLQGWS
ncbi:hypothetical protein NDU88_002329 [Pleurodeles waltl]|uniref:Uncharacterized protein n=1 Tax=Pleurodeles waltl TaxID=8319 RepID=A0AAV7RD12_PLEWA|nr:hypothetical protein NDU88_002329 [Pleurodeles waltl]